MELKDFVKNALIDLDNAIKEANAVTEAEIDFTQDKQTSVQFDMAVTIEDSRARGGKGAIKVFSLGEVRGSKEVENKTSSVTRISFSLLIH